MERLLMRPLGIFLTLWLALGWPPPAAGGQEKPRRPLEEVTAAAVWRLPGDLLRKFQECGLRIECVAAVMRQGGASPQAIAFTRMIKGEGYLESLQDLGRVDLASVAYPGRANTNQAYFLVNGRPLMVSVEDLGWKVEIRHDPLYPEIVRQYPRIMLWGGGAEFRDMEKLAGGGQRFVFAYFLVNGCHACEVGGKALVAFDFDPEGKFLGARLLRLTPKGSRD